MRVKGQLLIIRIKKIEHPFAVTLQVFLECFQFPTHHHIDKDDSWRKRREIVKFDGEWDGCPGRTCPSFEANSFSSFSFHRKGICKVMCGGELSEALLL